MKNLTLFTIAIAFFLSIGNLNAQNISISDVSHTADASAVLDVYSTSLGMLVPRLASAPSSPANGLFYYNTGSNSFFYNAGTSGSPSWTELSQGNLWSRTGTDTYLTNMGDNVVIGTGTSAPGYKFYVFGALSQMSRFDGQVEFWDVAGGTLSADVNDDGLGNGTISIYNAANSAKVRFRTAGDSYFAGGKVCIGATAPSHLLHLIDPMGVAAPQLKIDNGTGAGNASLGFGYSGSSFSQGLFGTTGHYELCNTPGLVASAQSDGLTMMRAFPSGIIDLNNQSRARAFQSQNPQLPMGMGQIIPYGIWTPIDFTMLSYDEQMEFTPAPSPTTSGGGGPAAAFFTATEEGYYQVNARTNFIMWDHETQEEIHFPMYPGFVSIGIVVTDAAGTTSMYVQGNKLQGADNNMFGEWNDLRNNLAPNVSDVVYLKAGETIEIWVWQDLWTAGLPLETGPRMDPGFQVPVPMPSQTYVSIHKSS
ncbi:MAG: hypothetical protein K9H58_12930 [Bacteroidales bacterium]|nr:hypothetical protein [Bacteroidales bacterium]